MELIKVICIVNCEDKMKDIFKAYKNDIFYVDKYDVNDDNPLFLLDTNYNYSGVFDRQNFILLSEYRKDRIKKILNG